MPIAWYPTRWWDWCIPENKIKEIQPFSIDDKYYEVKKLARVFKTFL